MSEFLTLDAFEEASEKVKEAAVATKLIYSDFFSAQYGNGTNKVYLKPENMQVTGAYKIRGAYYRISKLSDEERKKGVVTASAGNHAQGVAYAAGKYGIRAVIVMPTTTPLIKVNRTKALGAEVVLHGDVYDDAAEEAVRIAKEQGLTFVHPFDDPGVATGQGSIAMEIFKELPLVDVILVPVGGGGLATGVSTLAKLMHPKVKVIGVEPEGAACLSASFHFCPEEVDLLIREAKLTRETIIYLDFGSEEMGNHNNLRESYIRITNSLLRRDIYLETRIIPGGTHCEASWSRQIPFFMNTLLYKEL